MPNAKNYKPEIDGLRAVAVLLVLLCHLGLFFTGGFIGVDVFFVISGFLITGIVVNGMRQNSFSFWQFYLRRYVRLYPALIATVILTCIAGFLISDTESFRNLARTARYAMFSASNLFFSEHLGYFELIAQQQTFLHTWSLGVEWQYYLLWPLIIWLVYRCKRFSEPLLIITLLVIVIASVLASQWALENEQVNAAYYLMPYRAFELGIGGLLVFVYRYKIAPVAGVILCLLGLVAIFTSALIFTPQTLFPGYAALLPCLGAAACMAGGKAFSKGNVLRIPAVVFIGKASYSIYLVHWPVLVLYTYYVYSVLSVSEKIVLLFISLGLGIVFYLLIERRVNYQRLKGKVTGYVILIALSLGTIIGTYAIEKLGQGLPQRVPTSELMDEVYTEQGYYASERLGAEKAPAEAIFVGDSFTGVLAFGLQHELSAREESAYLFFRPGCFYLNSTNPVCQALNETVSTALQEHADAALVLAYSWAGQYQTVFPTGQRPAQDLDTYLNQTLENVERIRLQNPGRPLILVGSVPYRRWNGGDQNCLFRPHYLPLKCQEVMGDFVPSELAPHQANERLRAYADLHDNVYYLDLQNKLCAGDLCHAQDSAMFYSDGMHLSRYGSLRVAGYILNMLEQIDDINHLPTQQIK